MPKNYTDKSNARRKLLKSIAASSGAVLAGKSLPDSWSRPVVDAVILPAHAQASGVPASGVLAGGVYAGSSLGISQLERSSTLFARLTDRLVSDAHAATTVDTMDARYCFSFNAAMTKANVELILTLYTDLSVGVPGLTVCTQNLLIKLTGVAVGGGSVPLPAPEQTGCVNGIIYAGSTIEIISVNGMVTGVLNFHGLVDAFNIGLGACEVFSPLCSRYCR